MGLGKWIARKAEDLVLGTEESLTQEAGQLPKANSPTKPKDGQTK